MTPSPLLNVGVVGASGMVGREFLKILEERKFPVQDLRLFSGTKSEGTQISFRGKSHTLKTLAEGCFRGLDLVFFSAGSEISATWGPAAVREGAFAIDNSAAFRMDPKVLLVVPEVNGDLLPPADQPAIIANPNCSTIQLVVVLSPLMKHFGLTDVRVSSYQSVSGAGREAVEEFQNQAREVLNGATFGDLKANVLPHPIAFNNIPQIGAIEETGFCEEETKIMEESRKILREPELKISAFTVRTPTLNGHSESVWASFVQDPRREDILKVLRPAAGLEVIDEASKNLYPLNASASGRDPVYVGRIHKDPNHSKTWLFWVVADNIRKGAALNGIQIAEAIFEINRDE